MKLERILLGLVFIFPAAAIGTGAGAGESSPGDRWWSHVKFLADDKLEGRAAGSAGHLEAARYVAKEFEKLGLKPAGTEGYLQTVELVTRSIDESNCKLEIVHADGVDALELGKEGIISLRVDPSPSVDAELVFVGHGLYVPEAGIDDFKGLDLKGKVAVYLRGAPKSLPGPLAAHAQSEGERSAALRRAGAIGSIMTFDVKVLDLPWERVASSRTIPSMALADPDLNDARDIQFAATVHPSSADKLFKGSGHTIAEILAAADADKPLPHFDIPSRVRSKVAVNRSTARSQNVVAVLPGADPKLKSEYVVFSAHLDHLGIGAAINGDSLYNGAMDNASGVASVLDVAAKLVEEGAKPRRSIIFLAVTAEEKGLLGSRYFANHPTVPKNAIVADINVDMFLPIYPMNSLIAFGINESDLGDEISSVAKEEGLKMVPDPDPKRNVFIRSDQYSFIRQGIPSIFPKVGYVKGAPEEAKTLAWLKERYHAPSDDLNQPIDKASAAKFNAVVAKLLVRVADRTERPRWKDSSFFKRFETK